MAGVFAGERAICWEVVSGIGSESRTIASEDGPRGWSRSWLGGRQHSVAEKRFSPAEEDVGRIVNSDNLVHSGNQSIITGMSKMWHNDQELRRVRLN